MAVCRQNKELEVGMKRDEKWRGGEEADICGAPAVRSFSSAAVIDLLLSAAEGAEGGGAGGGGGGRVVGSHSGTPEQTWGGRFFGLFQFKQWRLCPS